MLSKYMLVGPHWYIWKSSYNIARLVLLGCKVADFPVRFPNLHCASALCDLHPEGLPIWLGNEKHRVMWNNMIGFGTSDPMTALFVSLIYTVLLHWEIYIPRDCQFWTMFW